LTYYEGNLSVQYNPVYGYDLSTTHNSQMISLWAPYLTTETICGDGVGRWRFDSRPRQHHKAEFSVGGFFLTFTLTLVISAVITGCWPLVLGMSHTIDAIYNLLKTRNARKLQAMKGDDQNDDKVDQELDI
jgi:hypothetical protein